MNKIKPKGLFGSGADVLVMTTAVKSFSSSCLFGLLVISVLYPPSLSSQECVYEKQIEGA